MMSEVPENTETDKDIANLDPKDPTGRRGFIQTMLGGTTFAALVVAGLEGCVPRHACDCKYPRDTFPEDRSIDSLFDDYCRDKLSLEKFMRDFEEFQAMPFGKEKETAFYGISGLAGIGNGLKKQYEYFRNTTNCSYHVLKKTLVTRSLGEWLENPEIMKFVYEICNWQQEANRIGFEFYSYEQERYEKTPDENRFSYQAKDFRDKTYEELRQFPSEMSIEPPLPYDMLTASAFSIFYDLSQNEDVDTRITSDHSFDSILYNYPLVLVEFMPTSPTSKNTGSMKVFNDYEVQNVQGSKALRFGADITRPRTVKYSGRLPLMDQGTARKLSWCYWDNENGGGLLDMTESCDLTYALFLDGRLVTSTKDPFTSTEDILRWIKEGLNHFVRR